MRIYFRAISAFFAVALLISSCTFLNDDSSSSLAKACDDEVWAYTDAMPVYQVNDNVLNLTINGSLAGKTVYLVHTNPTGSVIPSAQVRYIANSSNRSSACENEFESSDDISAYDDCDESLGCNSFDNFLKADFSLKACSNNNINRSITWVGSPVKQVDYKVGDSKYLYLDTDATLQVYSQKSCTLAAKGSYCNVWIADESYSKSTSDVSYGTSILVGTNSAQAIADKFDQIYMAVQNLFGCESDEVWYYQGRWFKVPMTYLSDTGTTVNLVICNIHDSSTVGYFYSKDYYPDQTDIGRLGYEYPTSKQVYSYSNEGKYLYLSSYSVMYRRDKIYSTLAHELTHLILYGTKYMEGEAVPDKWYDEMMAMLCEDAMQLFLFPYDPQNTSAARASFQASPKDRLRWFNRGYRLTGLEYLSNTTNLVLQTYADNYAFGAWLIRQYGGTRLLHRLASTTYVDFDSITDGVNYTTGLSYTMEDILKEYVQACTIEASTNIEYEFPTFNQSPASFFTYSYTDTDGSLQTYSYPLTAIDLWTLGSMYSSPSGGNNYKYDGPVRFKASDHYELRPFGFFISSVETVSDGVSSVTLTFNSEGSPLQKMYVIIN